MKQSAVQAFKSLASRIHPQLALSEKESQRLINALSSSFNHHLDQEFPSTAARAGRAASVPASSDASAHHDATGLRASSSSSTDTHLASILTNPLFGRSATAVHSPSTIALSQLKAKAKHPVQIFEESVSHGQATIEIARLCLNAFRATLKDLPATERASQLRDMAAGTRVLRWLWSSGKINAYAFAEDRRFLDLLTHFLRLEGNEAAAWNLVQTTEHEMGAKESPSMLKDIRRRKGYILCSLVKAHLYAGAKDDAITAFLRAFDANQSSPSSQPISLAAAGALLSKRLVTVDTATLMPAPSASLYDRFVGSCPSWDKNPSDRALYRVAALRIHHPISPSARDALYFIRQLKQSPTHPFLSPSTDAQRSDVLNFFFATVRLLQEQEHQEDAAWVMEFMQQAFPEHVMEKRIPSEQSPVSYSTTDVSVENIEHTVPALSTWRLPDLG